MMPGQEKVSAILDSVVCQNSTQPQLSLGQHSLLQVIPHIPYTLLPS